MGAMNLEGTFAVGQDMQRSRRLLVNLGRKRMTRAQNSMERHPFPQLLHRPFHKLYVVAYAARVQHFG